MDDDLSQQGGSQNTQQVGSQEVGSQNTQKDDRDRVWKLRGGEMEVISARKKKPSDSFMTLELKFTLVGEPRPSIVEFPYTEHSLKHSLILCNNALVWCLKLEDCQRTSGKYFSDFINQEFEKWQERRILGGEEFEMANKPVKTYTRPQLDQIGGQFYFISGDIFEVSPTLRQLTEEEVADLEVNVVYTGPALKFHIDEKRCYQLLIDIIDKMNELQCGFYDLCLVTFGNHLHGEMYELAIKSHKNYTTRCVCSGEATGTGKSLLQSVWMDVFRPEDAICVASITQAMAFQMLNDGENIYAKEFSPSKQPKSSGMIDVKFLEFVVPLLWEQLGKQAKGGNSCKPRAVAHIDGNFTPSDLQPHLKAATLSKIKFIFTGEVPIDHPEQLTKIDGIFSNAKELSSLKPVLFAMGIRCILPIVTDEEVQELSEVLKKPGDRREAQVMECYRRLFYDCLEKIDKFELKTPKLFTSGIVDYSSLTYFNTDQQEKVKLESLATELISAVESHNLYRSVEHSDKSSFKIRSANFPPTLANKLKCLKSNSTTFGGVRGQRVSFLPESDLSESMVYKLKLLTESRYDLWCQRSRKQRREVLLKYGKAFYASRDRKARERDMLATEEVSEALSERDTEAGMGILLEDDHEVEGGPVEDNGKTFECENKFCQDFGKQFRFRSHKVKHDRTLYHKEAKNYKF